MESARIIGIDPGSRTTGYGIIAVESGKITYVSAGAIHTGNGSIPERMHVIFSQLCAIIRQFQPTQSAIEQVFMARNPDSALKLGQARGAALVALTDAGLPVAEYAARQVKQATVGLGQAEKNQVQFMICHLLHLEVTPQADAADALAVAVCHAHSQTGFLRLAAGRYQAGAR